MSANNDIIQSGGEVLDDLKGSYMTFLIDDTVYGIELLYIVEIISVTPITHVPGLPMYYKGIINLRGKVVPVIDVRLKFGQYEREYDERTCILVVNFHDMQIGLVVDMVAAVATIDSTQHNPPPETGGGAERYLASIANINGKVILNIDCEKFFQSDLNFY